MNTKHLSRKIFGAVFSLSLLLGVAAMFSLTAQAQWNPYYGQDRDYRQDRDYDRDRDRDRRRDRDYDRDRDWQYRQNGRYNNGYYNNGYYGNDPYRVAQEMGYRAGFNQGDSDGKYGRPYNPTGGRIYRNGLEGYNGYGDKRAYKQAFQQAFMQGYNQGFQRYNGRYRNGGYRRFPF